MYLSIQLNSSVAAISARANRLVLALLLACTFSSQANAQAPAAPPKNVPPPMHKDALVGFGIIAGGQLRDWFESAQTGSTSFSDNTGRFMIGPTVQFHISQRVILEADAMRRGFGASTTGNVLGVGFSENSTGSSWEFPILLKRRFIMSQYVKPFLGAGISFRYLSVDSKLSSASNPNNTSNTSDHGTTFGVPISGGLEFRTGILRISPELRYTLWTSDKGLAPVNAAGAFNANVNQVAFLLSVTVN